MDSKPVIPLLVCALLLGCVCIGSVTYAYAQDSVRESPASQFVVRFGCGIRDKDMKLKSVSPSGTPLDPSLFDFRIKEETTAYFINPSYSFRGLLDMRAILTWYDYEIDARSGTQPALDNTVSVDRRFAYGLGVTGRYPVLKSFVLALDVNYVMGKFKDPSLRFSEANPLLAAAEIGDVEWSELLISPMLTHVRGPFAPYLGVRYSKTTSEVRTTVMLPPEPTFTQTVEYEETDPWSALLGTSILFLDGKLQADIQLELFNNEGVFITLAYRV